MSSIEDHPESHVRFVDRYMRGDVIDLQQFLDELKSDQRYHPGDPLVESIRQQLEQAKAKEHNAGGGSA